MCRYILSTCPYPDHDPIAALIFNPNKAGTWEPCDKPKPWGRLSCGNLSIEHPAHPTVITPSVLPSHVLAPRSNITPDCRIEKPMISFSYEKPTLPDTPAVTLYGEADGISSAQCPLCTTVLKLVSTKSKEIQNTARQSLAEFETVMNKSAEMRMMQKAVTDKIMELETLRHETWALTLALLVKENGRFNTTG